MRGTQTIETLAFRLAWVKKNQKVYSDPEISDRVALLTCKCFLNWICIIITARTLAYTHTYLHAHSHTHTHICTHTLTHTCTQTCAHTCTYSHALAPLEGKPRSHHQKTQMQKIKTFVLATSEETLFVSQARLLFDLIQFLFAETRTQLSWTLHSC